MGEGIRKDTVILAVAIVISALLLSTAICVNAIAQMGWPLSLDRVQSDVSVVPTFTLWAAGTSTPTFTDTPEVLTTLIATSVPTAGATVVGVGIGGRVEDAPLGVTPGEPAPVFTLPTLDGREVTVGGAGRPLVLNFWASWCPECGPEYPVIESIPELYGDVVDIWAVNWRESAEQVHEYFGRQGVELPVLLDVDGEVTTSLYVIRWIPTTIFIDSDGIIKWIQVGGLTPDVLEEAITLILPRREVPPGLSTEVEG